MTELDKTGHDRISRAIRDAEAATSGEIYCVLARTSDSYFMPAAFVLSVAILVTSLIAAFALHVYWFVVDPRMFAAAQLAALLAAVALLWAAPSLRIHFVPRGLRFRRAHANAARQFLAHGIHTTERRTGVLIFLSLAEHYGEVIADAGINEHVAQERWEAIVAMLTGETGAGRPVEGFVAAVSEAGALLAEHFPPRPGDKNELDDRLVEI